MEKLPCETWSSNDSKAYGKEFIAKASYVGSYENELKEGKEYKITIVPPILELSPLCEGIGDNGRKFTCHLSRFYKIKEA